MNKSVSVFNLSFVDYKAVWDLQTALLEHGQSIKTQNRKFPESKEEIHNYLLLCEHKPVFTLGKSGSLDNLIWSTDKLRELGIDYYKIDRGGDITYHGPGQLVGYPILDLSNFKEDLHWYLRQLEESCIMVLREYGLTGTRIDGLTGVWIGNGPSARKVMAIGVRSSRWITMHGFAFNIAPDMAHFEGIIPCGITDKAVTSLAIELGRTVPFEEVKTLFLEKMKECFGFNYLPRPHIPESINGLLPTS